MAAKEYKIEKVLISQVVVTKADAKPPSGHFPPDSKPYEDLKRSLSRQNMLIPVFVDPLKTIISGHYRYWAAKELGWRDVPVVVVDNTEDILKYLEKV